MSGRNNRTNRGSAKDAGRVAVWAAGIALAVAGADAAHAAEYYLQASQGTSATWNQLSQWFDQPSGGGSNPATFAGHDFFSNGFTVRTGTGGFTFGNATTNLFLNSKIVVRTGGSPNFSTVPNLITSGTAQIAAGAGSAALAVTNFTNGTTTNFTGDSTSGRNLTVNIGTLDGAGDLALFQTTTVHLSITDASGFTGNITWGDASNSVLNFGNDLVSGGGLVALGTSRIALDQNVTFASVTLDGVSLAAGTYSFTALNLAFDDIFVDGGSGSIHVVPEPASAALVLAGAGLALGRRRAEGANAPASRG